MEIHGNSLNFRYWKAWYAGCPYFRTPPYVDVNLSAPCGFTTRFDMTHSQKVDLETLWMTVKHWTEVGYSLQLMYTRIQVLNLLAATFCTLCHSCWWSSRDMESSQNLCVGWWFSDWSWLSWHFTRNRPCHWESRSDADWSERFMEMNCTVTPAVTPKQIRSCAQGELIPIKPYSI